MIYLGKKLRENIRVNQSWEERVKHVLTEGRERQKQGGGRGGGMEEGRGMLCVRQAKEGRVRATDGKKKEGGMNEVRME